jgi:hypothetical protein
MAVAAGGAADAAESPLIEAIKSRNPAAVRELIKGHANLGGHLKTGH